MTARLRRSVHRISTTHRHFGLAGVASLTVDTFLTRAASLKVVHLLALRTDDVGDVATTSDLELRFLDPSEVGRLADDPRNRLPAAFAGRARRGRDRCFAAINGDRVANYGWYALGSIEAEHASGTSLGLPPNVAYLYKAFTLPDFRGRRMNGTCIAAAALALATMGVEEIVAMVRWSNRASLRSCARLGFRRLGLLAVGPRGPLRVPAEGRRMGLTFGRAAAPSLEQRPE